MGFLVVAAILNAVGLLLLLGSDRLRKERHLEQTPIAAWLAGSWPIGIGGILVFIGVATAAYEISNRAWLHSRAMNTLD
jgi:hypothetical protein